MFRELCGDTTLKNVILVTNMWGEVSERVGETRERELTTSFFKPVLDKGAQLARHHNTAESARDIVRRIMKNQPITLQIQRELVDEGKNIVDTSAGDVINKELNEQIRRHQAELKDVQEEMMKALKEKDDETRQELEEGTRKLQDQMNRMKMDSEGMAASYNEEKRRMEEVVRQMQEKARQEREQDEAAHRQRMEDLNRQLEGAAKVGAAERKAAQDQVNHLQHQWNNRPRKGWFWEMLGL